MKKSIIISIVVFLAVLLSVNGVMAKDQPEGAPFKLIWKAIAGLQEQINHFTTKPGPQGPAGPQGVPGSSGSRLMVVDATGAEVGILLNLMESDSAYITVFNTDYNMPISYGLQGKISPWYPPYVVYYESYDCTGDPYVEGDNIYQVFPIRFNEDIFYVRDKESALKEFHSLTSGCGETFVNNINVSLVATRAIEFTPPKFVGPLSIVVK